MFYLNNLQNLISVKQSVAQPLQAGDSLFPFSPKLAQENKVPVLKNSESRIVYSEAPLEVPDVLDFNFFAQDKELAKLISKKLLFHIHAGKFGANSPLKGMNNEPLQFVLLYLSKQYEQRQEPKLKNIIDQLQTALNLAQIKEADDYVSRAQKHIDEAFNARRPLLMPSGWTEHLMFDEMIPSSEDTCTIRRHNLGGGSERNLKEIDACKIKSAPYSELTGVKKDKLLDPHFLKATWEMRTQEFIDGKKKARTNYSEKDVYSSLEEWLEGAVRLKSPESPRPMSPQEAGVCSFRSIMAYLATQMTRNEYKKFKCNLKIQSLVLYHQENGNYYHYYHETFHLAEKSLRKTSASVDRLVKGLDQSAIQALEKIRGDLDKASLKNEPCFYDARKKLILPETYPVAIPCRNINEEVKELSKSKGPAQKDNKAACNISEKFKSLNWTDFSKAYELCKEASKENQFFELRKNLAHFILELPLNFDEWKKVVPKENGKEALVLLGKLGKYYFKACFEQPNIGQVSDEKRVVLEKIYALQQHCTNLFIEIPGWYAFGDFSNTEFFPHAKIQKQWVELNDLTTTWNRWNPLNILFNLPFNRADWGREAVFNSKNELQSIFNDASFDAECAVKFNAWFKKTHKEEDRIELVDYVRFYASDDLPAWLKSIRTVSLAKDYLHNGHIADRKGFQEVELTVKEGHQDAAYLSYKVDRKSLAETPLTNFRDSKKDRYLLQSRNFKTQKMVQFYGWVLDKTHVLECNWLDGFLKNDTGLPDEEFCDLCRLFFSGSKRTIETINYFTKHPEKFKELDYQTIFIKALFNRSLFTDLKEEPFLAKKAVELLSNAYKRMNQSNEMQSAVFLLQGMRYLSGFPNVQLTLNPENELRSLLNRENSTEEKSVIYAELLALFSEKSALDNQEMQDLLTAWEFIERYPVLPWFSDPYTEEAARFAPLFHAEALRNYMASKEFPLIELIKKIYPGEELSSTWSLREEDGFPVFRSGESSYSPLQGNLFLESQKGMERDLPKTILEQPNFAKLFPEIRKAEQLSSTIYRFADAHGRETLILNSPYNLYIEQNFEGVWKAFVPEEELVKQNMIVLVPCLSRSLVNNFFAWGQREPQTFYFVDPKSGAVKYTTKEKAKVMTGRFYVDVHSRDNVEITRTADQLVLSDPSNLMSNIEDEKYIHEWYLGDELKEVELPRFGLTFVKDAKDPARFHCEQVKGFYFRPKEILKELSVYRHYLVLESEDGKKKKAIFSQLKLVKPSEMDSLEPKYDLDRNLDIGDKSPQKYYLYDVGEDGLLETDSLEANLYTAAVFTLIEEYSKAAAYLKHFGHKLSSYTQEEKHHLETIANLYEVTGDNDPNAKALRTYASFLLLKNGTFIESARSNAKFYLSSLNSITAIRLSKDEEIFLLKTLLNTEFDPVFFLRLKELEPHNTTQLSDEQINSLVQTLDASSPDVKPISIEDLPDYEGRDLQRPNIKMQLVTRISDKLDSLNFYNFYELARTATSDEKNWLEFACLFNRSGKNCQLSNFLEVVAKFPDQFEPFTPDNFEIWKKRQTDKAYKCVASKPEIFVAKRNQIISNPVVLRGKVMPQAKAKQEKRKTPFTLTFAEVALADLAKEAFSLKSEPRDERTADEIRGNLEAWKLGDNAIDSELDRLINDVNELKSLPLRPIYTLEKDLKSLLKHKKQPELEKLKLELLGLANKEPSEEAELMHHRLKMLSSAWKPLSLEELIINFGRQEVGILEERNPALSEQDIATLYSMIGDYLLLATYEQQRKRCSATLKKIEASKDLAEKETLTQQLAEEILAKRCFDPKEQPIYLSFEYFLNGIIREEQLEKIAQFRETPKAALQMPMGFGKTKYLLQLIGHERADKENLSLLIEPEPLFSDVGTYTQRTHLNSFGKRLRTFHFDRNSTFTTHSLQLLLDDVKAARKNGECVILTSKSISCLLMKYIEQCVNETESPEEAVLEEIVRELIECGYPLMDEIDTLLHILHEISFSAGELVPVDECEYTVIAELYQILYTDPNIKDLAFAESDPEPNKKAALLTAELYHKVIKEKLAQAFIERLKTVKFESSNLAGKVNSFAKGLDEKQEKHLLSYLCQEKTQLEEAQEFYNTISDPDLKNIIALASEEISRFLPYTLSINSNENYGFGGKTPFAIPYSAANKPSHGSDFKNSHITMNTTFQMYLKDGFPKEVIEKALSVIRQKAIVELMEDPSLDIEKTEGFETFKKFKGILDLPLLKTSESHLQELYRHVNSSIASKSSFVINCIFPYLKRYSSALTFTPQNLAAIFDRRDGSKKGASGFTGTLWNSTTMHHTLTPVPKKGTDANTLVLLREKSKNAIVKVTGNTAEEMLDCLGSYDMLIDCGAYFKDRSSAKMARSMALKYGEEVNFYSKKGVRKTTDGKKVMPYKDRPMIKRFLDQSQKNGADEKLLPLAKGIITIGRNILLRDLLQSAWRMRGLDRGQTVSFAVSEEVESIIRAMCHKPLPEEIDFDDILRFAIYNQAKQLGQDNFKAFKMQFWNIPQMILLKAKLSGSLAKNELNEAKKALKELWFKPVNQKPKDIYGVIAKERPAQKVIEEEKEKIVSYLKSCFEKIPSLNNCGFSLETSLKEVDKIETNFALLLPPNLQSKELDDDQTVELQMNEEVEKNVETNLKTEEQKTIKFRRGFKAFNHLKKIKRLRDDTGNYLSLEVYLGKKEKKAKISSAFQGIDLSRNVLQFDVSARWDQLWDPNEFRLFGPQRTSFHHLGIDKEGRIILFSLDDAQNDIFKENNLARYHLTLGAIDPISITPEIFERIVKIKFLNGECNYNKKEQKVLREWLLQNDPEKMRAFFLRSVLLGLPVKLSEYNSGSTLKNLFNELTCG